MTNVLTDEQLTTVKDELRLIKAMHRVVVAHMDKAQGLDEGTPELLAELIVVQALQEVERDRVDALAEILGIDFDAEDKLAEVINILDGNRRVGRH